MILKPGVRNCYVHEQFIYTTSQKELVMPVFMMQSEFSGQWEIEFFPCCDW